jgi:hypothetical protein
MSYYFSEHIIRFLLYCFLIPFLSNKSYFLHIILMDKIQNMYVIKQFIEHQDCTEINYSINTVLLYNF